MSLLKVNNISAGYADHNVVSELSFHVNQGEIVSLLGASGCGKTTVLRAIAGFEPVRAGSIDINATRVSAPGQQMAPERRSVGMVFQDYALFPHLTISDNIAFGLRKLKNEERRYRVKNLLSAVGLPGLGDRYPHELSGGQQQRVALARALAPAPAVLLMDEPFSNLDVDLRERLSLEVRDILKTQGITGIMVTHDQHEAFAISDKIGVMHEGSIIQWDTPYNLYHEPNTRFVADFIGQGEFILGTVIEPSRFETEFGILNSDRCAHENAIGRQVDILLRPDDLVPDPEGSIDATVVERAFKGAEILYTLQTDQGTRLLSLFPSHRNHALGEQVRVSVAAEHLICFPHQE
jgi:iron(III) transport system ATP-binding protein